MRESFVIHSEYIEDLPEESKAEFLLYIYNYATKGIEPDLDSFAKTVWLKIKRRIEYDIEQWENTKTQRSESGKIGGLRSGEARRSKVKQNEATLQNAKQDEANEAVYVSDNVSVNEFVTDNAHTESAREAQGTGKLQQICFDLVSEHNKTAPEGRKIPVSKDFISFVQKEMRLLLEKTGCNEPQKQITAALENFIKVTRSDTWQNSCTWKTFCNNYVNFTPEYFTLSNYLKTYQTDDATKRPENIFFHLHKNDPRFKWRVFRDHYEDWEKEGRPDGEDYYKLQDKWEGAINDITRQTD